MKLIYITLFFTSVFFYGKKQSDLHVAKEYVLGCNCDSEDGRAREECLRLCFENVQFQIKDKMDEQNEVLSKPVVKKEDNARYYRIEEEKDSLDREMNKYRSLWLGERSKRIKAEKEAEEYKAKHAKSEEERIAATEKASRLAKELKLEKMKSDSLQKGWDGDKVRLRLSEFSKGYTVSANRPPKLILGNSNKDITLSCAPAHDVWNDFNDGAQYFMVCEITELVVEVFDKEGDKIKSDNLAFDLDYAKNSMRYWSVSESPTIQGEPFTLSIKTLLEKEEKIIPFKLKDAPSKGHAKVSLSLEVYFAKKRLGEEVLKIGNLMKVSQINNYICSMKVDRRKFHVPEITTRK